MCCVMGKSHMKGTFSVPFIISSSSLLITLPMLIEILIAYDITYMWSLKYDTNEPIYETETEYRIQRTVWWLLREWMVGEGWIWSLGLADANEEWINNKVLL